MRKIHAILEALYWRDVTSLYIKPTWQRRLPAVGVGVAMFTVLAFGIVRLMDGFLVSALAVRAVQVSGGSYHSLALSSSGAVYAWGWNGSGQLGNGTTADSHIPVAVKVVGTPMAGKNITQISAGGSFNDGHSLARASDGTVYAWGRGVYGQLGNGTTTDSNVPVAVKTVGTPMAAKTITQISAGAGHSLALASDGTVYAWGQNTYGQLGNNVTTNSSSPVAVQTTGTPMAGKSIVNIAAGGYHSLALADDGTVYAWGYNPTGQLGNGATVDSRTPVAVKATGTPMAGKNIIKIAAGVHNSLALASDGTVYTWGRGEFGQLGNGTTTDSNIPVAVKTVGTPMASKTIIGISGGPAYMLAVDSNGKVYGWGRNANGQLGSLSHTDSSVPVASQIPAGKSIIQVSAGGWDGSHSLALTHDNIVYGRGRNSNGQLGNNSTSDSLAAVVAQLNLMDTPSTPTQVVVESGNAKATISWQSPVVTGGKSIVGYVLRYRTIGAVDWTTVDVAATVTSHAITGLTNDQIYQTQVAAKTTAGTGDFSNVVLATPHAKPTITNVSPAIGPVAGGQNVTITGTNFMPKGKKIVQTANGNGYSLALASDGTVYAWGLNGSGQLGDGTITHSSTPVAVKTIGTPMEGKTIVEIAAGASHSLALASDGKIYVWGGNAYGQFGNGVTTTSSVVPVAVKTVGTPMDNKKIIQIHAGYYHSLALASDGTVYAWGQNTYGQLGNNTMINANAPVSVQTIGTPMAGKIIIQLAAGNSQSVALASDGTIYAWGWNMYGQLGNGTTVDTRIPVAVKVTGTPMAGKVIAQVAASNAHTLAVASDGTVYDWGWNQYGQLGNNTTTNSSVPVAVQTTGTPMVGKVISQVTSGGSANSLALASDGTMYTWGWSQHGQLGNGTIGTDAKTPLAVSTTPPSALAPSAPKVTFDGIEATNVTVVNSTTITAATPAHAAGLVDVAIDLGNGDELYKAVKTSSYRYATVPDAPTNLATAPLDNAVRLTWTAPANNGGTPITDYVIQYSADGGITWSTYSHIASTSTTVTIPFLTPTTYTFRVAAVNAIGTGAYSATATGQIRYITLSAPTSVDIAVTPAGGTKMSSKSANVLVATNAATGYKLSLSTQNANRNLTNGSQTITPTAGTQIAPATLSGSAWGYRVNGIGNFGSTTTAENNVASSAYTWAGVPDHTAPHVIRTTAIANPTAETTTVWYGVSATGSQQSGIYTATVTYTAINN